MSKASTPWFNYPTYHWQSRHAVVIGAGIAGCQMTYQLSQQGWHVTLIEQASSISQQASGNLAGVISPKMTAQTSASETFYRDAFEYTLKQLATLSEAFPSLDWYPCGMLQLAHNDAEKLRWQELNKRHFPRDFLQLLGAGETIQKAGIRCDYASSYFPRAGYINPKSFCEALLTQSSYDLVLDTNVASIEQVDGRWSVKDTTGSQVADAEIIIVCTGKELTQFSQSQHLSHTPVLGQTSLAKASDDSRDLTCVICHEGYLTPSYQQQHVFGATFDRRFDSITVTDEATIRNTEQLEHYLSEWRNSVNTIENGHAAVRTTTPDRFPYVGALPSTQFYQTAYSSLKHGRPKEVFPDAEYHQGLFILGGLGARGLTTSGYCAQLLMDVIHNKKQDALLSTMHPARYLIRQLRRGKTIC
ncbi:FAD-dependent oxidoreductase [Leucothrix sargassi]|nr:FAD-dependent oxidoreductase [Leucothrix sargassi]